MKVSRQMYCPPLKLSVFEVVKTCTQRTSIGEGGGFENVSPELMLN